MAQSRENGNPGEGGALSPSFGPHKILIVDDEPENRMLCRSVLEMEKLQCGEAQDGEDALRVLSQSPFDLVLLDIDMPKMKGTEVLRRLREKPPSAHLKIIMLSGRATGDDMARLMREGADDYLGKPFSIVQLLERVKASLRLKDAQVRSDLFNQQTRAVNHELEQNLAARDSDLIKARNALVLSLAELVAIRDVETGAHLLRVQNYCRVLAEESAKTPGFASQIDAHFISMMECCAPLHDIGKVGVPDSILLKPGKLTPEEFQAMQKHTTTAADILTKVAGRHPGAASFLQMAIDIARHHHEWFDGTGYPDRLKGDAIPLPARILAVADVYDALRSARSYKPGLPHETAFRIILEEGARHFDPALVAVFQQSAAVQFEKLYNELTD